MTSHLPSVEGRNLAEVEYDYLAAVVERIFLVVFCIMFMFMSFGINGIGFYYYPALRTGQKPLC